MAEVSIAHRHVARPQSVRKVAVSDMSPNKQAIVLGMVELNVFPGGLVQRRHAWFSKTAKGADCLSDTGRQRLTDLIALGYQRAVEQGRAAAQDHLKKWSAACVAELMAPSTDSGIDEGIRRAQEAAETTGLPQTVFRGNDTGGWTCTNALARCLETALGVALTALPSRYFT